MVNWKWLMAITSAYNLTSESAPLNHQNAMVPTLVPSAVTPAMVGVVAPEISLSMVLYIHMTPYNSTTLHNAISQASI